MHLMFLLLLGTVGIASSQDDDWMKEIFLTPKFDESAPKNVTAVQGSTAILHCKLQRLHNKMVSWIRSRDLHILSVGTQMYTTDARFHVTCNSAHTEWSLRIRVARVEDSGLYECQVSGRPVVSYQVQLSVIVPVTSIVNTDTVYLDAGTLLNLTCIVSQSPEPASHVFWYHNDQAINFDSLRGGITVVTKIVSARESPSMKDTVSHLLISETVPNDSGHYTCSPSNAPSTRTRVHVLSGERPAAMHTSGEYGLTPSAANMKFQLTVLAILLTRTV